MENSADEKNVIAAANALLDRGIGKPAQVHIGGDEDDAPIRISRIDLVNLT